ncbi:MAG: hypothetical protein HZA50_04665 [Planctomycetes bacterium]|nr:hypothetical protein [Planctomycetota bacterium]
MIFANASPLQVKNNALPYYYNATKTIFYQLGQLQLLYCAPSGLEYWDAADFLGRCPRLSYCAPLGLHDLAGIGGLAIQSMMSRSMDYF